MPKKSVFRDYFSQSNDGYVCNLCQKIVKASGNTTNFSRHLQFNHTFQFNELKNNQTDREPKQPKIDESLALINSLNDGDLKYQTDNLLAWWIAKDCLPFRTTESNHFRAFIKKLNPHYKVPGRNKVSSLIEELYIKQKEKLIEFMNDKEWFCLTSDSWKDTMNQRSYVGITIHFIHDYKLCSACLRTDQVDGSLTSSRLLSLFDETLDEWQITKERVLAIITDGGANFKRAAQDFGQHIHCVAHKLNLVVETALNSQPSILVIIDQVKTIVTTFKQSSILADDLRNEQQKAGGVALKLIQNVETRWNSTYIMLKRYLELRKFVSLVLLKNDKREIDLSDTELNILSDIVKLLQPFFDMTEDVSGEKYVTISRIIPLISCALILLNTLSVTQSIAKSLKVKLICELEERFRGIESNQFFTFATLLDPRFKRIDFRSTSACAHAVNALSNSLAEVESTQSLNQSPILCDSLWAIHDRKADSFASQSNSLNSGLKHYLELDVINRNDNPLEFWSKNKENWPHLHNLAVKYLTVQATSVPSERLFSKTGQIISEKRNRIKPKNVNHLCFLQSLPTFFD